jgi:hypothetical protein
MLAVLKLQAPLGSSYATTDSLWPTPRTPSFPSASQFVSSANAPPASNFQSMPTWIIKTNSHSNANTLNCSSSTKFIWSTWVSSKCRSVWWCKRSQPEYAGIEMIRMPHVHSNISMTAKLGVINSQFYRFLRLCSCKKFFVFQMVSLIVFLKAKGYPFKVLLKRTRGLVLKEKFLFGISAFGIFRMILLQVI